MLAYRCLHGSAPATSSVILRRSVPSLDVHISVGSVICIPRTNTSTIGPRAFAISSLTAWNCLPVDLRDPGHSLLTFRRKLKIHLFNLSSFKLFCTDEYSLTDQHSVIYCSFFLNTIFVSSHMYPENPEGTQVIVGSMNMGYISDTARNRTHNLFPSGSRYH